MASESKEVLETFLAEGTSSKTRVIAFLRLFADRIEQRKPWDIPATMAAALRVSAKVLEEHITHTNLDDLRREWEKVRALDAKATPGPWVDEILGDYITGHVTSVHHQYAGNTRSRKDSVTSQDSMTANDAAFIAASRQWPALISSLFALVEEQAGRIKQYQADVNARQAKIDSLMLEYCPSEMSPEQVSEFERHQMPANDMAAPEVPQEMVLHPDFGDPNQLLNMRDWLQNACESQGAKMFGGGCGMGQADIDIRLPDGFEFNVNIKPLLKT